MKNILRVGVVGAGVAAGSAMAALPEGVQTALTAAQTSTIEVVGAAGLAMIAVAAAGVVWKVAAKFIKGLSGKA